MSIVVVLFVSTIYLCLTYYDAATITEVMCFIVWAPGGSYLEVGS
jgi:hypothetical protein